MLGETLGYLRFRQHSANAWFAALTKISGSAIIAWGLWLHSFRLV
jgi:hypothetical protein